MAENNYKERLMKRKEEMPYLCLTAEESVVMCDTYDNVVSWIRDMQNDSSEHRRRSIAHYRDMYEKTFDDISNVEREMYEHAAEMEVVAYDGKHRIYRRVVNECLCFKKAVLSQDLTKLGRELTDAERLLAEDRALFSVLIVLNGRITSQYFDFLDTLESHEEEWSAYRDDAESLVLDDTSFECFNRRLLSDYKETNAYAIRKLTAYSACDAIEAICNKINERMDEIEQLK